jgi:putative transposase
MVCIEDSQVPNMSKSSKGNAKTYGKQVKQKSGLSRVMRGQGWGECRR